MIHGNAWLRSTFGARGNFEAAVYLPGTRRLQHYWRENTLGGYWRRGFILSDRASAAAALVFVPESKPGRFEAIVTEGDALVHYAQDMARPTPAFTRGAILAVGVTGAAALVRDSGTGRLDLAAPFGSTLRHFIGEGGRWREAAPLTEHATGPATLLVAEPDSPLQCVVPEGKRLVLYYDNRGTWKRGPVVSTAATGTAGFGALDTLVPEGTALVHYTRATRLPDAPWRRGAIINDSPTPILAASLLALPDRTLAALVQEGPQSVFEYGQDDGRWQRTACLRLDEGAFQADQTRPQSEKVVNLTQGNPRIQGTDLGASVEHRGRLYFLFGDTFRAGAPPNRDALAVTESTDFAPPAPLQFHRSFPRIVEPTVDQGAFAVPADGFSYDGHLYAFFTTDPFQHHRVMGRSVLTRCTEDLPEIDSPHPLDFTNLGTFSDRHFINVAAQTVDAAQVRAWQLPPAPRGLLLWGTGPYRCSTVRLAFLSLAGDLRVRRPWFYSGKAGWTTREEAAVPLFTPGAVGELSVRWQPLLKRFVLLYCTGPDDPLGLAVQLRISKTPYGPWSKRRLVLNWQRDGLGTFLHRAGSNDGLDNGSGSGGAAYAPYQVVRATLRTPGGVWLYYALSCWNPYQVVLLRHWLADDALRALEAR